MSGEAAISTGPTIATRVRKPRIRWFLYACFLLVYAWAYTFLGTISIREGNTVRSGNFQSIYIDATYRTAAYAEGRLSDDPSLTARFTRRLPQVTDGLVDPLWPWLVSGYADLSPDELFEKGKWLNMLLACSFLVVFGVTAARAFSFTGAAALILMGGFGVILERSTYFSADTVHLLLVVLAWLCALSLIRQNQLWLYGVFGALLGLTYLAKGPVWPFLAGFLLMSVLRALSAGLLSRRRSSEEDLWSNANQWVGLAIFATAFLLVAGPRLSYATAEFGDPFHSLGRHFVWLDSPAEAAQFQRAIQEEGALNFPDERKPGPVSFLRENGWAALFERAIAGAWDQLRSSMIGRQGRLLAYTVLVFLVVAVIHRSAVRRQEEETWLVRGTSARWMIVFLGGTFFFALFYAGIGNPVVRGNPLVSALFLPTLLTFIWIAERYRRQLQRTRFANLANRLYLAMMLVPVGWISFRIYVAIQSPLAA